MLMDYQTIRTLSCILFNSRTFHPQTVHHTDGSSGGLFIIGRFITWTIHHRGLSVFITGRFIIGRFIIGLMIISDE